MAMWNRLKFENTNLVSWNTKKFPQISEIGPILMLGKTQKKKKKKIWRYGSWQRNLMLTILILKEL